MIDWRTIRRILWGNQPQFPNLYSGQDQQLPDEGLTMGTHIIGRPGTGKTSYLALHLVEYAIKYPDRAIFVLDWSGAISDTILSLIQHDEGLLKRVVYDEMGHPEWVVPLPEFSPLYGGTYEEQSQRVSQNLVKLAPSLVENAPILGRVGLRELAPQIFRVCTAIRNEHDECWQVTEVKKLLLQREWLKNALNNYGNSVPEAKWYLFSSFMSL